MRGESVLVLGLGSRLMTDDGIGVALVEALAADPLPDPRIAYGVAETDLDCALDLAARAERLILIDAAQTGRPPGEMAILPLHSLPLPSPGLSLHDLHHLHLLAELGLQEGVLIGIEPFTIALGLGLSPAMQRRFPALLAAVKAVLIPSPPSEIRQLTPICRPKNGWRELGELDGTSRGAYGGSPGGDGAGPGATVGALRPKFVGPHPTCRPKNGWREPG